MLNMIVGVTKVAAVGLWAACILSLLAVIPEPIARPILAIGVVVLVVHLVEYLIVRAKVAEQTGGNSGFLPTMVYGFAHWLPVLRRPPAQDLAS